MIKHIQTKIFLVFFSTLLLWPVFSQGAERTTTAEEEHLYFRKPFIIRYKVPHSKTIKFPKNPIGMRVLIYKDLLSTPETLEMKKKGNIWEAVFTLKDTSVKMIMFAFQAEDSLGLRSENLIDNNNGNFWDVLVYNKSGKPVRGAYQARALSYTGFGGKRKENLEFALEEIKKELSLYPDNFSARSLAYNILLRKNEFSEGTRKRIEHEVDSILKKYPQNETVLSFATESYRMIGKMDKAQKIENKLIQLNPKSNQAAGNALNKILRLEKPKERAAQLENFLVEYPNSPFVEFALSNLASVAIELNDSTKMIEIGDKLLRTATTPAGASGLAGIAGVLSEKKIELDRAVAYARKALNLIRSVSFSSRPPEISQDEWKEQLRTTKARYKDILGWAYFQKKEFQKALAELKSAAEVVSQGGVYYHLARVFQQTGNIDEALINYARATAFGDEIGDKAYKDFQTLWLQANKKADEMEQFLDTQVKWVEENYKKKVLSYRSVRPAPDFELEDLSGDWVRLSDQKGNVILLCFWASWSKSSRLLLKELKRLAENYGQEVLFITITTDVNISSARRFVRKEDIPFSVLINDDTDQKYGVQGVPTLFVIDKNGNINFEHKGYNPDISRVLKIELENLL